ncbi:MAG: hypothetical protein M9927_08770 [Anaerolineae bacterium]|nr:hypothetical protein [Anaerolineae bacterium]
MTMTEARYSANFRLVRSDNLPVNLTFRADEGTAEEFAANLGDFINGMLASGWRTREASLAPNQDIQEAAAYIVGRTSNGDLVVHLFKPPLEKRTGYCYQEQLDKLPFKLTGSEPEFPIAGTNPTLPGAAKYLVHLPATFQFIRTEQGSGKDGGRAPKRYTEVYYVPASMQADDGHEGKPATQASAPPPVTTPPAATNGASPPAGANGTKPAPDESAAIATQQSLDALGSLCLTHFGDSDAREAGAFITKRYLTALAAKVTGTTVHEDPAQLTEAQIAIIIKALVDDPEKYKKIWRDNKLGWLSRPGQPQPAPTPAAPPTNQAPASEPPRATEDDLWS